MDYGSQETMNTVVEVFRDQPGGVEASIFGKGKFQKKAWFASGGTSVHKTDFRVYTFHLLQVDVSLNADYLYTAGTKLLLHKAINGSAVMDRGGFGCSFSRRMCGGEGRVPNQRLRSREN